MLGDLIEEAIGAVLWQMGLFSFVLLVAGRPNITSSGVRVQAIVWIWPGMPQHFFWLYTKGYIRLHFEALLF